MPAVPADLHFFALLYFHFRANASEAKPCRSESLRCTTFPSQITSALFSAIPSPCPSVLLSAAALLRAAATCCALPSLFIAVQCCSVALPCCALPLHSSSPHSLCHAPLSLALPLQLNAELFRCNSAPCFAKPGLAVQCLRESGPSMPCRCLAMHRHTLALRSSPHRQCRQSGPFRCCATGRCRAKFHNPTIHEQPFRGCRQEGLRQTRRCCPPGSPHC